MIEWVYYLEVRLDDEDSWERYDGVAEWTGYLPNDEAHAIAGTLRRRGWRVRIVGEIAVTDPP